MASKLFQVTGRDARPTIINALMGLLGFGLFAAPQRKVSAVLASSGGKFTDSLERDLDFRWRDICN